MKGLWLRSATIGLVAGTSLWLSTSVGEAQKARIQCEIPVDPVPGTYQGKYTALLLASGGGAPVEVQYSLSGNLQVKVASGGKDGRPRVTAADGDMTFGYGTQIALKGAADVNVDIAGGGKGSLELASADPDRFVMSGSMDAVSMTARGAGPGVAVRPQTTSGRGGAGELVFKPAGGDCLTFSGTIEGPTVEQTRSEFLKKGMSANWDVLSFKLELEDEHGLGEARQKIQQQMAEVQPKPRPNALRKLREIHDDMEKDAASRPDEEKACLRKVYVEAYFPLARGWLNEDLKELSEMRKRAATLTELDRTRMQRLIGQILGRAREAQLANCGWPEANGALTSCGDAAIAVENALLKTNQKLWDGASVADILHWAKSAALLSVEDDGRAIKAVADWASGVAWAQFRAIKAVPKGDAAALDRACRDAWAAARQAQLVGGDAPSADDLVGACRGTGSAT